MGAFIGSLVLLVLLWVLFTGSLREGWYCAGKGFPRNFLRFLLMMVCWPFMIFFPPMIIVGPLFGVAAIGDILYSLVTGSKPDPQAAPALAGIVVYFILLVPAAICMGWLTGTSDEE